MLFDDAAVYVAVRLFDGEPGRIVAPFPRRDDEATSDWVFVEIDSRLDRRNGLSFGVNPRGVQVDGSWFDDVSYDEAWNGVWSSAAAIDSLGWTVEYRIPFSQFPLAQTVPGQPMTWGLNVYRATPHRGEVSNWSPRLPSITGIVSRFNELRGLVVPPRAGRLELVPYVALRDVGRAAAVSAPGVGGTGGADIRWRPTPATTVAVSVHPDFGQVEADPSQVNLTTFETFLPEQRPLFVEGTEVFQFNAGLAFASRGTSFEQESPFYSRRIGRAVHGACPAAALDCESAAAATLLGAVRASGHSAGGWAGGVFNAWTGSEHATFSDSLGAARRSLTEPLTSFTVGRVARTSADGRSEAGFIGTAVDRMGFRDGLAALLPRSAFLAGAEGRTRFGGDRYEVSGFVMGSWVAGSGGAIAALKSQPRHGYDRADSLGATTTAADTTDRSLSGTTMQARVARVDGRLQWDVAGRLVSRGFEANDAGFQRNADWLVATASWRYIVYRPGHLIRQWSLSSTGTGLAWTLAGQRRAAIVNLTGGAAFRNYWGASLSLSHEPPVADPEVLRGGPALRLPARDQLALTAHSDSRRRWLASIVVSGARAAATSSRQISIAPDFSAFVTDRFQVGLSPFVGFEREGWQYVDQAADASARTHYVLGALSQTTAALTARATYAFSSRLTLQLYTQAFLAGGRYAGLAEVVAPAAERVSDRTALLGSRAQLDAATGSYVVDRGASGEYSIPDPAFSERDFHANLVLRWEFVPGSTLFVAWTQERSAPQVAAFEAGRDLVRLFQAPASNALLVKVSYWISR